MSSSDDKRALRDIRHNRTTFPVARFAPLMASRLDAHPGSADMKRIEDETRIVAIARQALSKKNADPIAVNVLSQAVEMHTQVYGFSKVIYEEILRLNDARIADGGNETPRATKDASFTLTLGDMTRKKGKPSTSTNAPKINRGIKV